MSDEHHIQPQSGTSLADNQERHVLLTSTSSMDNDLTIGGIITRLPARASTLPSVLSAASNTSAAVIARSLTFTLGTNIASSNSFESSESALERRQLTLESVDSRAPEISGSTISFRISHLRHGWLPTAALLLLFRSGNYAGDVKLDRQTIVDELGTYIGHHTKGRRIQYWTTISVFFLLIKLCAVRGAPLFTFIDIIYVVSWSSVEILLILLQQNGLSEDQVDVLLDSRRAAAKLERLQSWGSTVWFLTSFCTILVILIISAFKTTAGFN